MLEGGMSRPAVWVVSATVFSSSGPRSDLLVGQLLNLAIQCRRSVAAQLIDLRRNALRMLQHLRASLALRVGQALFQLREFLFESLVRVFHFAGEFLLGLDALALLGLDALAQRVHFLLDETGKRVEPLGHVLAHRLHLLRHGLFEAREALLEIPHLRAKQYVANLIYVRAFVFA